jgi:hypothetical protein
MVRGRDKDDTFRQRTVFRAGAASICINKGWDIDRDVFHFSGVVLQSQLQDSIPSWRPWTGHSALCTAPRATVDSVREQDDCSAMILSGAKRFCLIYVYHTTGHCCYVPDTQYPSPDNDTEIPNTTCAMQRIDFPDIQTNRDNLPIRQIAFHSIGFGQQLLSDAMVLAGKLHNACSALSSSSQIKAVGSPRHTGARKNRH